MRAAELSLKSLERGRWQEEQEHMTVCIWRLNFSVSMIAAVSATANQEIFVLAVQESHMTALSLHPRLDWLQHKPVRRAIKLALLWFINQA